MQQYGFTTELATPPTHFEQFSPNSEQNIRESLFLAE